MRFIKHLSVAAAVIALAASTITPVSVFAQTESEQINNQVEDVQNNREQLQQDIEENRAQREELRNEQVETRCTIAETRIDTVTARYTDGTLRYVNRYNNLVERLNNVIDRLNEEGVSTTELSGYVEEITNLTMQFNDEMNQTIETLEQTKQSACGNSEGAYLDLLQQSRSELLEARSTAVQINNIFLTDVVDELKSIRAAI